MHKKSISLKRTRRSCACSPTGPKYAISPPRFNNIRWLKAIKSLRLGWWMVQITLRPDFTILVTLRMTIWAARLSKPLVGSSRNKMLGFATCKGKREFLRDQIFLWLVSRHMNSATVKYLESIYDGWLTSSTPIVRRFASSTERPPSPIAPTSLPSISFNSSKVKTCHEKITSRREMWQVYDWRASRFNPNEIVVNHQPVKTQERSILD